MDHIRIIQETDTAHAAICLTVGVLLYSLHQSHEQKPAALYWAAISVVVGAMPVFLARLMTGSVLSVDFRFLLAISGNTIQILCYYLGVRSIDPSFKIDSSQLRTFLSFMAIPFALLIAATGTPPTEGPWATVLQLPVLTKMILGFLILAAGWKAQMEFFKAASKDSVASTSSKKRAVLWGVISGAPPMTCIFVSELVVPEPLLPAFWAIGLYIYLLAARIVDVLVLFDLYSVKSAPSVSKRVTR